jgi:hypothetical protein
VGVGKLVQIKFLADVALNILHLSLLPAFVLCFQVHRLASRGELSRHFCHVLVQGHGIIRSLAGVHASNQDPARGPLDSDPQHLFRQVVRAVLSSKDHPNSRRKVHPSVSSLFERRTVFDEVKCQSRQFFWREHMLVSSCSFLGQFLFAQGHQSSQTRLSLCLCLRMLDLCLHRCNDNVSPTDVFPNKSSWTFLYLERCVPDRCIVDLY